jgi:cytidine deaminase
MTLYDEAFKVRQNAHAPYSNFPVGAALRSVEGGVFVGCNVENVAYPLGSCAEANAISAMVAAGHKKVAELLVLADAGAPVTPCGGCRQKIAELADKDMVVTMLTLDGLRLTMTVAELLPGAFNESHMDRT